MNGRWMGQYFSMFWMFIQMFQFLSLNAFKLNEIHGHFDWFLGGIWKLNFISYV